MDRTLYAVHMVSPMNAALSQNIEKYAQSRYDWPATLFTSEASALQYIEGQSKNMSARATTTPIGNGGRQFLDMPGIGIIATVTCPEDTWQYVENTTHRTAHAGIAYTGFVSNFNIQKEEAIFQRSELHPFKSVPLELATPEFIARWNNFQMLDYSLQNTSHMNRADLSWDMMPTDSLRMVFGRGGMVESWYQGGTPFAPQDARFDALMKDVWENSAGIQYMSATAGLFSAYRDVYARNIVSDVPMEDAQIKAAIVVANRLSNIAEKTNDFAMAERMQGIGEDLIVELNGRDETTLD